MADFGMNIEPVGLEVSPQVAVVLVKPHHRDLPSLPPTASAEEGKVARAQGAARYPGKADWGRGTTLQACQTLTVCLLPANGMTNWIHSKLDAGIGKAKKERTSEGQREVRAP